MRKSNVLSERVRWWLVLFGVVGLYFARSSKFDYLIAVWSLFNIVLGVSSFTWMLFHPRAIGKSSETALSWSRWVTILASAALYVAIQTGSSQSNITPTIALLIVVASAPFIYCIAAMFSLFGASLGAFNRRKSPACEDASVASVRAWWLAAGLIEITIAAGSALNLPDTYIAVLIVGAPTFTLLLSGLARRLFGNETRAPIRFVESTLRRLVIYRVRDGETRKIDLRGVTIGLFTAIVTVALARTVTAPAQQGTLASLFRLRSQIKGSVDVQPPGQHRVVLVKMDSSAQAAAVTDSSESAVQAAIIRRLIRAKVDAVVLPAPTLDPGAAANGDTNPSAVKRTLRDLSELADAMRAHGKVILVASEEQRRNPKYDKLVRAAWAVGQFGVDRYGAAQLPTIPLTWKGDPPAPLLAFARAHERQLEVQSIPDDPNEMRVAGSVIAQAIKGRAVLDFRSSPSIDLRKDTIPTYPYETIMHDSMLSVTKLFGAVTSMPADDYLQQKVVFLEPLIQSNVETPIGVMPQYEMLARISNSLINGAAIQLASPVRSMIWVIILGGLIGGLCAGRDPLQASWRVALLLLLNFGYSLIAYLAFDSWADPVLPLLTAAVAFLLVTQLTFSLERDERERNRQLFSRFIAKEFVDELLQSPQSMRLALGGEKRTVCVLFADVRNFTGFAESHRPEEVIEIMNIYLTALTDALDAYGGVLDKYTGDGLMAFFEVKGDVCTELSRAVNSALAMREAAIEVSEKLTHAGKRALEIGIGMHYGEAIVGLVGNEKRQINYTALGHTVVVSARLQTLAEGGDVVVSEPIYDVVRDHFSFTAINPVHVKGISTELRPFYVSRLRPGTSDIPSTQVTKERPL